MPDPVHLIPLDAIDEHALARDRTAADPAALDELAASVAAAGLRMPVELFALEGEPGRYGLISGFRRLAAFRALRAAALDPAPYAAIPAFVRAPAGVAEALTAMVEENAIRCEVSAWEQAAIALTARDRGVFATADAAIETLYANLSRDKRRRLRAIAQLVEELEGHIAAPESLSLRQLLRLAAAASRGYAPLMRHALAESRDKAPEAQWRTLLPILTECEAPDIPDPQPSRSRPRRTWTASHHAIRIRRELTRDGWCLHFTGRDATGPLIDDVFDEIERLFSPAEAGLNRRN
jgi:ParB family transcriptional regulator, chromosome partitioning protein